MCEWCEKRKVCLMCGKPLPKENELHPVRSNVLLAALTDDELSALICACQFADNATERGHLVRPAWGRFGTAAHRKLITAEFTRAANANVSGPKGTPHDVVGQYLTGQCGSCRDFRSNGGSCESSNPAAYNGCWASLHPNADLTGPLGPERKP